MSQLTNNFFVIDPQNQFSFGAPQRGVCQPDSLEKPVLVTQVCAQAIAEPQIVESDDTVEELKNKAKRLNHLLEVMPAGVVVLDQRGHIKQANQQAVELLGAPLENHSTPKRMMDMKSHCVMGVK
jgi:two-component system sensor histidine kinase FlrB